MAWQLTQCLWRDRQQLDAYLRDSWEPFAVSETDAEPTVWLRRLTRPEVAGAVEPPRRPLLEREVPI